MLNNFSGSSLKNNSGYFSFSYAYFSEAAELLKISGALGYVTIKSKNFEVGRESEVFFHARGVVKSFIWASNEPIEIGSLFFYPKIFTSVTLAPTGVVSQLITDKDVQFTNNQGQKVKYFAGDTIHFL